MATIETRDTAGENSVATVFPKSSEGIRVAVWLALLLCGYLGAECFVPMRTAVQIGGDEGFELAKALLWKGGYQLYEQVWNDQPPLHTWILTKLVRASRDAPKSGMGGENAGSRVPDPSITNSDSRDLLAARLVSVFFGCVLIAALFSMALKLNGLPVAVLACAMLICSPGFLGLCASCMLEVPAFATAVASMALLVCAAAGTPKEWWLIAVGGAVFGAAIMMKLVPLMLSPLIAFILWRRQDDPERLRLIPLLRSLLLFGLAVIATVAAIDILIEGGAFLLHLGQTWSSHFGAQQSFEYGSAREHPFDWTLLLKNWDSKVPALLALCLFAGWRFRGRQVASSRLPADINECSSIRRPWPADPVPRPGTTSGVRAGQPPRNRGYCRKLLNPRLPFANPPGWFSWWSCQNAPEIKVLPAIWLLFSMFVFAMHKPWWTYYYVHLEAPLCWCAAIAMVFAVRGGAANYAEHKARTAIVGLILTAALLWTCGRVYFQIGSIRSAPRIYSDLAIAEMARFKPFTQWLYADEPIYSFHAGIPFPPNLAVIMYKRLWSGDMTNEKLAAELGAVKPGLILLKQDTRAVAFQDLLEREYRLVYYDSAHRLYAHSSISKKPGR
jgi:4-amino-4-deoxy-L-arabinose transferase-like glycosyltransferase